MKRIFSFVLAILMALQATVAFAQSDDEPSTGSVLDAARQKYWGKQDQSAESGSAESGDQGSDQNPDQEPPADNAPRSRRDRGEDSVPYAPIIISFAPGLSFPFGYWDASLSVAAVGSVVRDVEGIDASGVFSVARDIYGVEAAGVFDTARDVNGGQAAGVFNVASGSLQGIQAAGVFNIAQDAPFGLQVAGVFNVAHDINGFQSAGVFNSAGNVSGGQIAGVVNVARDVHGVQIGVVNIAREVDGLQLGLVNISENGVDSLGFIYEPTTDYLYAYWQAGTPFLFALAGYGSTVADSRWDYGQNAVASLGLGTRGRFLFLNIDLDVSAEQMLGYLSYDSFDCYDCSAWDGWRQLAPYPTVKINAGLRLGRHWQIVGGLKMDVEIDSLGSRIPSALKVGRSWDGSLMGQAFSVWPKWYFGFKF